MNIEKVVTLVKLLAEKTEKATIKWELTEKPDVFQASFSKSTIRLSPRSVRRDVQGRDVVQRDFVISIYNENGDLMEEASDVMLKGHFDSSYTFLEQMYQAARRAAMGVDVTIDQLLIELQGEKNA